MRLPSAGVRYGRVMRLEFYGLALQVLPVFVLVLAFEARALNSSIARWLDTAEHPFAGLSASGGAFLGLLIVLAVFIAPLVVPVGFLFALNAYWTQRDSSAHRIVVNAAYVVGCLYSSVPIVTTVVRTLARMFPGVRCVSCGKRGGRLQEDDSIWHERCWARRGAGAGSGG